MAKFLKQFSVTSLIYLSVMGVFFASQAMGFKPTAALAALGK